MQSQQQNFDPSVEGFLYYAGIVLVTLYVIAYGIEFILKRVGSSLEYMDISLISRRIAALSIHFVVFLLFSQSLYILYLNNRFFNDNLPSSSSYEYWTHNKIPKSFDSETSKLYFYLTKTDIAYSGLSIYNNM